MRQAQGERQQLAKERLQGEERRKEFGMARGMGRLLWVLKWTGR